MVLNFVIFVEVGDNAVVLFGAFVEVLGDSAVLVIQHLVTLEVFIVEVFASFNWFWYNNRSNFVFNFTDDLFHVGEKVFTLHGPVLVLTQKDKVNFADLRHDLVLALDVLVLDSASFEIMLDSGGAVVRGFHQSLTTFLFSRFFIFEIFVVIIITVNNLTFLAEFFHVNFADWWDCRIAKAHARAEMAIFHVGEWIALSVVTGKGFGRFTTKLPAAAKDHTACNVHMFSSGMLFGQICSLWERNTAHGVIPGVALAEAEVFAAAV